MPPVRYVQLTNRRWLYLRYVTWQRTLAEIGCEVGCSERTVSIWLNKHRIPVRGRGRSAHTKAITREQVVAAIEETGSQRSAAARLGIAMASIRALIVEYDIPAAQMWEQRRPTQMAFRPQDYWPPQLCSRVILAGLYAATGRSQIGVARLVGCHRTTVGNALDYHQIPRRGARRRKGVLTDAA